MHLSFFVIGSFIIIPATIRPNGAFSFSSSLSLSSLFRFSNIASCAGAGCSLLFLDLVGVTDEVGGGNDSAVDTQSHDEKVENVAVSGDAGALTMHTVRVVTNFGLRADVHMGAPCGHGWMTRFMSGGPKWTLTDTRKV